MNLNIKKAILALADGTVFEGRSFGAEGETVAEVCFNTSLTGYQEILTDPSYKGQIVTMTYTEQGNYGTNDEDAESIHPWVEGFIVKEPCARPSSWRSELRINDYLVKHGIVGIYGIDTRALTRLIRTKGAMQGVISTVDLDAKSLVAKAMAAPSLVGRDLVKEVTCAEPYEWSEGLWDVEYRYDRRLHSRAVANPTRHKVVAFDFGIKRNILRHLHTVGCDVTVVPASTTAAEVLKMNPDGIFLSNGPGDPDAVGYARDTIKELIGKKPIFGICLGHQLLSLALGGSTYKLKFGHRGGNQPVQDLSTTKVEITSQNHGFAVDLDSMKEIAELTHINLNDKTVEGISHKELPLFSVQHHPEASPGPHDSAYLFKRFVEMMG
ncbi:MAG: glutamine-hydrolyzing carbamoyl-phosphate synthase small subunit [Proteobacteria bacterium]|nr:glutamine-hydrolyzing carbamoyl-phosphate synthase small subunit [Pseudomonadota bacterium]